MEKQAADLRLLVTGKTKEDEEKLLWLGRAVQADQGAGV